MPFYVDSRALATAYGAEAAFSPLRFHFPEVLRSVILRTVVDVPIFPEIPWLSANSVRIVWKKSWAWGAWGRFTQV